MSEIEKNLNDIRRRIRDAAVSCGRTPESVQLLAVTKRVSAEVIAASMRYGQTIFAESYVQEARKKLPLIARANTGGCGGTQTGIEFEAEELTPRDLGIEVHLVGALQKNKVKHAVGFFEMIQSVDRYELADLISREAEKREIVQKVLLQINISNEPTKSGFLPREASAALERILLLDHVRVCGLMSIGTWHPPDKPKEVREAEFAEMAKLQLELSDNAGCPLPELSMGMSGDFELAIEHGATMVRLGTALFGRR